jgi:hypothetical protein
LDNGQLIDSDQGQKLFSLSAKIKDGTVTLSPNYRLKLEENYERQKNQYILQNAARNQNYFEQELDKLDKWSEDKRSAQKLSLKEYDDLYSEKKRAARLATNLPDKIKIEREIRDLEHRRDEAWKEYDSAKKEIEKQKDKLLDEVEMRLRQNISESELFAIHWTVI